jgi:hypothetical protein
VKNILESRAHAPSSPSSLMDEDVGGGLTPMSPRYLISFFLDFLKIHAPDLVKQISVPPLPPPSQVPPASSGSKGKTAPYALQKLQGKGPDAAWFASRRKVENFGKALLKLASRHGDQRVNSIFDLFSRPETFDVARLVRESSISEPLTAGEVTSLVTFLERRVSGDVHAGTLSFPEAQRVVQQLAEWVGQPVTLSDVKSVMSVARANDIADWERGIKKLNPDTVISLVVDANDSKEFELFKKRYLKFTINITVVTGLFYSEKTINAGLFESAAKRILTQSPNRTLLVLPGDVAFSSGEFKTLSPELMKLFVVTTLESLLSEMPKAISLETLLRISRILAVNA